MLSYMGDLMPIGEFSVRSGLSQKRLRSYAAAGVLVPAAVDSDSGYRYYAQSQLSSALLIDALRKAEIPLSDITEILREPRAFDFDRWLLQLESDTAARRAGLEAALRLITNEHNSRDRKGTTGTMLEAAGRTETGPVRRTNQDAPIIGDRIVGVADGMGGAPAGEIASALAATILERAFAGTGADELSALVRAANAAIFARAAADPALTGMGTTLCCAGFLDDGRVTVVNVGDSRAYVLRAGVLRQVTTDHTVTA
ncbi:MAG: family protein phosphatase, partial [Thermoleophilaceae bacterium]|nr:family protein phosphatase [Thermoleophilaceae bacterium]